jgi:hypothetical protein
MSAIEVRTVVYVVREPLWRYVLAVLAGDWVLAAFSSDVAHAGERFGIVLREIQLASLRHGYDWNGTTAIVLVIAASCLGAWVALHSMSAQRLSGTNSKGIVT